MAEQYSNLNVHGKIKQRDVQGTTDDDVVKFITLRDRQAVVTVDSTDPFDSSLTYYDGTLVQTSDGKIWVCTTNTPESNSDFASTGSTYTADGTTITLSGTEFSQKSGVVTAGTKGSATKAPVVTVDTYGRVTTLTDETITPAWGSVTGKPETFTPSSHTHGNLTNDGKVGTNADKPVVTTTGGAITAGSVASPITISSGTIGHAASGPSSAVSINDAKKTVKISVDTYGHTTAIEEKAIQIDESQVTDLTTHLGQKAPTSHASTATTYGVGSTTNYGHVKVDDAMSDSSTNPVQNSTIKAFVNSSINALAAYYITKNAAGDPFATHAELAASTTVYSGGAVRVPTRNDYCIVLADETNGGGDSTRYTYDSDSTTYSASNWAFQYVFNKQFTQAQVDAMNSGITSAKVGTYDGYTTTLANTLIVGPANNSTSNAANTTTNSIYLNLTQGGDVVTGSSHNIVGSNGTTVACDSAGKITIDSPALGTTHTTAAYGDHTHTTTLATDAGTSSITLAHDGKYKLTAGGTSVIFTMPSSGAPTAATATPSDLGTAAVGTSAKYAREDHVHKMPSASDVGALSTSTTYAGSSTVGGSASTIAATKATTTKAYVMGTTLTDSGDTTPVFDTGVYLDTTAGKITATTFSGALSGNATTATNFSAAKTIALTDDVTGSASSTGSSGWSISTALSTTGVTNGSYGPTQTAATTLAHGGKFKVPKYEVDAKGRLTSSGDIEFTLPGSGNTDAKVQQKGITTNGEYPILLKYDTGTSDVSANYVNFAKPDTVPTINPSTGDMTANGFKGILKGQTVTYTVPTTVSVNRYVLASCPGTYDGTPGFVRFRLECTSSASNFEAVIDAMWSGAKGEISMTDCIMGNYTDINYVYLYFPQSTSVYSTSPPMIVVNNNSTNSKTIKITVLESSIDLTWNTAWNNNPSGGTWSTRSVNTSYTAYFEGGFAHYSTESNTSKQSLTNADTQYSLLGTTRTTSGQGDSKFQYNSGRTIYMDTTDNSLHASKIYAGSTELVNLPIAATDVTLADM